MYQQHPLARLVNSDPASERKAPTRTLPSKTGVSSTAMKAARTSPKIGSNPRVVAIGTCRILSFIGSNHTEISGCGTKVEILNRTKPFGQNYSTSYTHIIRSNCEAAKLSLSLRSAVPVEWTTKSGTLRTDTIFRRFVN